MPSPIIDEVSGDELMRHENAIAQYVRLSGSPEEAKAFDYIEEQLKGWGYDVHRYASEALIGYPDKARLTVNGQEIPCNGYSLSPSTGDAGVSGELLYIGAGHAADYEGKEARG